MRKSDPVASLGHRVVAVDDSVEMPSHVHRATTVVSSIQALRLGERFDVVLLASYLINTPDTGLRAALLAAVARHLADDGRALIQWHPPDWFDALQEGRVYRGELGDLHSELTIHTATPNGITATVRYLADDGVRYLADDGVWTQSFEAGRLTADRIADDLLRAGLELVAVDPPAAEWLVASAPGMRLRAEPVAHAGPGGARALTSDAS